MQWITRCGLGSLILSLLLLPSAAKADFIRDFDVRIELRPDASLDVNETITVEFTSERHGIFRIIPVRYERYNNPFTVDFRLQSITDENGNSLRYSQTSQGRDVNIKIGDPNVTVSGAHVYQIHYTVRRAVNFFSDAPEVYWNATGDQWPYPIQRAHARLIVPAGIDASTLPKESFVGPPGSRTPAQMSADAQGIDYRAEDLAPGSGLTIVAGLPAKSVTKPSLMQELLWFLADWWPVGVFPGLALALVIWRWRATGRDEGAGTQAVGVEFEPPKDLTPAEVGTLIDESCDTPDVVATLIDLAARGYLKIQQIEGSAILFLSSDDYIFTRAVNPPAEKSPLLPHEQRFLDGLFGGLPAVQLSDLKNRFYTNISPMKDSIYSALTSKGLFKANPQSVRAAWSGVGIVILIGGALLAFFLGSMGYVSYAIGLIISGIILTSAAKAMPAKTLLGTRKLMECLSFKRFVSMVEKDRLQQMAGKDPTIFGRLLPYAMVLGVADQWAEAFRDLVIQPPDWYSSYNNRPFNSIWFTSNLGSGMRTMQRTMVSQPQSSGGSGGSGFSGGGSGGGFGGGGGGSW